MVRFTTNGSAAVSSDGAGFYDISQRVVTCASTEQLENAGVVSKFGSSIDVVRNRFWKGCCGKPSCSLILISASTRRLLSLLDDSDGIASKNVLRLLNRVTHMLFL